MNITLVGTKIVQDTKFLAFEKNSNVDVINITVDTNGEWTYKLDVRYPDKCCTGDAQYNIINLVKTDDIYTAVLTSDMLPFSGKYTMQIRAINGDKIQHSDTFDAWVKYSIEPGETYNPAPSEFYQIEANVTEINNHPPYPSDDGYWMIYNVNTHEYEKSEIPVIAKPSDGLPDIDITTDGKYLSNDGTKAIWATVEAEQELFICTITGSGTAEHPYTCDKTTADIMQAKHAGKVIYAYDGTIFYPATVVNNVAVRFEVLNGTNDMGYMLLANGAMAKINVQLQQTSNRVTSLSASSTDAQYPSAKCVWGALQEVGGGGETWEKIDEIPLEQDTISYILTSISGWRKIKLLIRKVSHNTGNGNCWLGIYTGDVANVRVMVTGNAIKAQYADIFVDVADYFCMELQYGNNFLTTGTGGRTAQLDIGSGTTEESVLRLDVDASYTAAFDGTGTITVMGVHA